MKNNSALRSTSPTGKVRIPWSKMSASSSPYVRKMGIPQEFRRLRRDLQSLRGSDFLVGTRCMTTHPTSTNCFIESYGLNFVPDDAKRDSVLQEFTEDEESSPGGRRGLFTQMLSERKVISKVVSRRNQLHDKRRPMMCMHNSCPALRDVQQRIISAEDNMPRP